ncbi:hypothetical protein [Sinomonas gamaensis]|uniref:hypothetical protein n=1 Tax=Sinomonas gamaensis TaxID=2565624 RepID=UPI0014865595|nr:hypothetical protein [Sinomonas gamaensis]
MAVESRDHGYSQSVQQGDRLDGTESGHGSGFGLGLMRYYEERQFMSPEERNRPLPELPRSTRPEIQAIAKAEIDRLFGRAA